MSQHGFTLLELMTTLAVGAILLLIGVPGLQNLLADTAVQTEAVSLHTALHHARSQAIDTVNMLLLVLLMSRNSAKKTASHTFCYSAISTATDDSHPAMMAIRSYFAARPSIS